MPVVGVWMLVLSVLNFAGFPLTAQAMLAVLIGGILFTRLRGPLKACPCWMAIPSIDYYFVAAAVASQHGDGCQLAAVVLAAPAFGWVVGYVVLGKASSPSGLQEDLLDA